MLIPSFTRVVGYKLDHEGGEQPEQKTPILIVFEELPAIKAELNNFVYYISIDNILLYVPNRSKISFAMAFELYSTLTGSDCPLASIVVNVYSTYTTYIGWRHNLKSERLFLIVGQRELNQFYLKPIFPISNDVTVQSSYAKMKFVVQYSLYKADAMYLNAQLRIQ